MEGEISFMKYFRINYSCGCGEEEEILAFETLEGAEQFAYEMARENYQSYEGLHGVRSEYDIARDLFFDDEETDEDWDWDTLSDEQKDYVWETYCEEVESQISYSAEELTEEEYLEEI